MLQYIQCPLAHLLVRGYPNNEQVAQDLPALEFNGTTWSYKVFFKRVATIQKQLREQGLLPGDRVGIYLWREPDLMCSVVACILAGYCWVPLDPMFPVHRLQSIAQQAQLKAILCKNMPIVGNSVFNCTAIKLDHLTASEGNEQLIVPELPGTHAAYIMFTSGSTGNPKGVEISRKALAQFLGAFSSRLSLCQNNVTWLATTTLAFDISIVEILSPLTVGGCVVLVNSHDNKNPQAIASMLNNHARLNYFQATPTFWRMLFKSGFKKRDKLVALVGGEAVDKSLLNKLFDCSDALWHCYGPTEATVWSLVDQVSSPNQPLQLQNSLQGYQHFVLGRNNKPVAKGEEGELCIAGPALAAGYWKQPDMTAKQFFHGANNKLRLYKTGDQVRKIEDDAFQYLGRLDDQVKLHGFRIELGEIESHLRAFDGIANAAVKLHGEGDAAQLVAYVEFLAEHNASKLAIRKSLSKVLPAYMVPARIIALEALPLTVSGKIDRKSLQLTNEPKTASA